MEYIVLLIGGFFGVVFLLGAVGGLILTALQMAFLGLVRLLFGPKNGAADARYEAEAQEPVDAPESSDEEQRREQERHAYCRQQQEEEERDRLHLHLLQEEHLRREEQRVADEYAQEHSFG